MARDLQSQWLYMWGFLNVFQLLAAVRLELVFHSTPLGMRTDEDVFSYDTFSKLEFQTRHFVDLNIRMSVRKCELRWKNLTVHSEYRQHVFSSSEQASLVVFYNRCWGADFCKKAAGQKILFTCSETYIFLRCKPIFRPSQILRYPNQKLWYEY